MKDSRLKEILDGLYDSYKHRLSSKDPVWILHRFEDEKDIETLGLITAAYAYGSVDQINSFIDKLLFKTGSKLYEFTTNFSKRKDKKYLADLSYRFNTAEDLLSLFANLNAVLIEYGSLKNLFLSHYNSAERNIIEALKGFSSKLNQLKTKDKRGYYHYLVSNPKYGSACKRMNLFLRWMVRKDEIDFGLWNEISTSALIMPVDTHIGRISKELGLVNRKTIDLNFAIELTRRLRQFDPVDPVKYDFALCHYGIDKRDLSKLK